MTKLRPFLPCDPAETPVSWATRLAALHTGESVLPFMHDIGIHIEAMRVNRDSAIEKLCAITGEDPDRVWPGTIKLLSWRNYALRGIPFTTEFLHGKNTMFCPACLAEDDAKGNCPAAQRRGQTIWLLRPVRTCPKHHLPLVEREAKVWSDRLRELSLLVPERGVDLKQIAAKLVPRAPSPLQDYVLARLDGKAGPDWLDGQQIEQAFRTTEMLGVGLEFGTKPNLKLLTGDDWDRAGRAGFEFARHNEDGIREALTYMHNRFVESGLGKSAVAGPQMVFGRLYQWLEFNSNKKDPGPIRNVLREHVLNTMEVAPEKILLGELVGVRRRHNVKTLSDATGTHYKTLGNFLTAMGMIPADGRAALMATFDAVEGERMARVMKNAIPQLHLPKALNTTRGQAIQLVEVRLLPTLTGEIDGPSDRGAAVAIEVIEQFLADLRRNAVWVDAAPAGMLDIPEAAKVSRVTATVIVRLLQERKLTHVFQMTGVPGYGGVLIDPEEVRGIAAADTPVAYLSVHQIRQKLSFSTGVVKALMESREGGALLPTVPGNKRSEFLVPVKGVDAFSRTYVSLTGLGKEIGMHHMALLRNLNAAGVKPIDDPDRLRARIYRRSDIPNHLTA